MSAASFLQYAYLAYFSNPASERLLYRVVRRVHPISLVELGVGMGKRSRRLIRTAMRYCGNRQIRYTGVDLFEARPADQPGWSIKQTYRELGALGAKVQLIPGDPWMALARNANGLLKTDLMVIAADQDREALSRAWTYVPRMLHEHSYVFLEQPTGKGNQPGFQILQLDHVQDLAGRVTDTDRQAA